MGFASKYVVGRSLCPLQPSSPYWTTERPSSPGLNNNKVSLRHLLKTEIMGIQFVP